MKILHIIKTPWESEFVELVRKAEKNIYLASPFIKEDVARLILDNKQPDIDCKILTKFTLPNIRGGGLDLAVVKSFQEANFSQKNISNLHAKIFIFDHQAIITSANLTNGGLRNNLEYGVLVDRAEEIREDFLSYYNDEDYRFIENRHIDKVGDLLKSLPSIHDKLKLKSLYDDRIFSEDVAIIKNNLSKENLKTFECVNEISEAIFTTTEIYQFKNRFSGKTPENTIRRNLQELRDYGLLEFVAPGKYKKLW